MKYKVGDKVKVKSLKWYNKNKDERGYVNYSNPIFFEPNMSKFCDTILTIKNIDTDLNAYEVEENEHYWIDVMIEGLAKDEDLEFQRAVAKTVDECLWGVNDEIDVYKETDPTEKLVDDSVEFGKNVMKKKISEYLLKYLPMTPDDKESFVEEMNKNIK
jgi:hypothetical protein